MMRYSHVLHSVCSHLVAILLRGTAVFLSLVLMLCVSVVITAGVSTTCVSASQSLLRL